MCRRGGGNRWESRCVHTKLYIRIQEVVHLFPFGNLSLNLGKSRLAPFCSQPCLNSSGLRPSRDTFSGFRDFPSDLAMNTARHGPRPRYSSTARAQAESLESRARKPAYSPPSRPPSAVPYGGESLHRRDGRSKARRIQRPCRSTDSRPITAAGSLRYDRKCIS